MEKLTVAVICNIDSKASTFKSIDSFLANCNDQELIGKWFIVAAKTPDLPEITARYPFAKIIINDNKNNTSTFNLLYQKVNSRQLFYFGNNWEFTKGGKILSDFNRVMLVNEKIKVVFSGSDNSGKKIEELKQWYNTIPTLISFHHIKSLGNHDTNEIGFDKKLFVGFQKYGYRVATTIVKYATVLSPIQEATKIAPKVDPAPIKAARPKVAIMEPTPIIKDAIPKVSVEKLIIDIFSHTARQPMTEECFTSVVKLIDPISFNTIEIGSHVCEAGGNKLFDKMVATLQTQHKEAKIVAVTNFVKPIASNPHEAKTRLFTLSPALTKQIYGSHSSVEGIIGNIRAFAMQHKGEAMQVEYFSIAKYQRACMKLLGAPPMQLCFIGVIDEYEAIKSQFADLTNVLVTRSPIDMPVERKNRLARVDSEYPCKKESIANNLYVNSVGRVSICDNDFDGEIVTNQPMDLSEFITGKYKLELVTRCRTRAYTKSPCNNPKCCMKLAEWEI